MEKKEKAKYRIQVRWVDGRKVYVPQKKQFLWYVDLLYRGNFRMPLPENKSEALTIIEEYIQGHKPKINLPVEIDRQGYASIPKEKTE
jgi:hypothetical protein